MAMTFDALKRLREEVELARDHGAGSIVLDLESANDAADEIDRLRDRMQGAHETIKALTTERDAARAEVAGLVAKMEHYGARRSGDIFAKNTPSDLLLDLARQRSEYRAEVERLTAKFAALREAIERVRGLVESAHRGGYSDGWDAASTESPRAPIVAWSNSAARAALDALKGE